NGPASPPSAVRTRSLRPLTMPSHSCCPSGSSSSRRTYGIRLIARTITSAPPAFTSRHPLPLPHPDALPRPLPVGRLSAPPPRPPPESRHPSPTRRPLLSHTILTRLFIRITYLISEYAGNHGQNTLICSEKQTPLPPDGRWSMSASPASADPGRDDDLAWLDRDPMTAAEREASLDRLCEQDEGHLQEEDEYGNVEPFTVEELAEIREAAADELLAVEAATTGRRGPGQPGSARVFPGQSASPAAGFGPGMPLDLLPGCPQLAVAADAAVGEDGGFAGVSEAELVGVVCAWDRVESHAGARKLAAIAELARRNPAPEDGEFAADELANALAESRSRAGDLIDLAQALHTRLPGTAAALCDGTISRYKAGIIAGATALLDPAEARAAEDKVLDRAARLTPGGLRAAIAHAVMEVAPEKAKERREQAARDARVERWIEDSGNAALMGCELPPDEVLAADQRITAWAKELKKAGLEGDMDVLRARAFLDLLLGKDSRPRQDAGGGDGTGPGPGGSSSGGSGPGGPGTPPSSAGPAHGAAGFA